ncbi:MAG: ATP-binding protein, partial [Anaerococcus vaginalis]|nr:ATP-binding protein [Anaerococcus vaginalis]
RLVLDADIEGNIPIVADRRATKQIMVNLLSNAVKFTPEGGRVTMRSRVFDDKVVLIIADTGIGIPQDKQKLIFEAFQQADAGTSRKYGGTGLGLAISRELANLLGGEIHLKSAPGKGSTFTLYLPLKYSGPAVAPRISPTPAASYTPPLLPAQQPPASDRVAEQLADDRLELAPGDTTLLIVEDDPHYARVLIDLARDKGFKILVATRLWLKEKLLRVAGLSTDVAKIALDRAQAEKDLPIPGYTHIQRAVVSSAGMWWAGWAEAFIDNAIRARDTHALVDANPLGTAAGYGVNLPLDREHTTAALGFARMQISPIYAQLSRGKFELAALEALGGATLDLRRIAWDLSLFTSAEF